MSIYNLLLVDDVETNIYTLTMFLEEYFENINIFSSLDVDSAKEIVHKEKIDLILCDLQMPEKDGIDFAKYILANNEIENIPFIIITGIYDDKKTIEKAYNNGVTAFISKPFDEKDLYRTVQKLLNISSNVKKETNKDFIDLINNIN